MRSLQFLACGVAAASDPQLVVKTGSGLVQGKFEDGIRKFLGVPFASAGRFQKPQPTSWTEPFNASDFGPGCFQGGPSSHNPDVPAIQSEDCLNVNIYTPAKVDKPLPVMLWLHGGAFKEGSNEGPFALYDGKSLVSAHDVVIIAANYRMQSLGWLALPADFGTTIKGNFGLMDQRAAMQWTQQNAAAFGGDPAQVTIWGESAGAMSIGCHMAGNKTAGLFSAAIMESNVAGFRYRTSEEAGVYGKYFVESLPDCAQKRGVELESCLQVQDLQDIRHAASEAENRIWDIVDGNWEHFLSAVLSWTPVVDGDELPDHPQRVFAAGNQQKVPLLAGANSNEGTTFIYDKSFPAVSGVEFKAALRVIFGLEDGQRVGNRYPVPLFDSARGVLSTMLTDYWFRCSTLDMVKAQRAAGLPAFGYRYNHAPNFKTLWPQFGLPTKCEDEVCHMAEIPFVFNNYAVFTPNVTAEEFTLAKALGEYWTTFAKTHLPSSDTAGAQWPMHESETRQALVLDVGTEEKPGVDVESMSDLCDFWDSIGYMHAQAPTAGDVLQV